MDVDEIEYINIKMEIVINTVALVMEKLGYDLDENYAILLENNCREVYDGLRSYEFLLNQLTNELKLFAGKYQEQVELHYSH